MVVVPGCMGGGGVKGLGGVVGGWEERLRVGCCLDCWVMEEALFSSSLVLLLVCVPCKDNNVQRIKAHLSLLLLSLCGGRQEEEEEEENKER